MYTVYPWLQALYAVLLGHGVWALSPTHIACQLKKSPGVSPLTGCAPGTLFVSQDDANADFTSVQDAILSL